MRTAPARVIPRERRRKRHLALVDNIEAGETIVAKAQQKNDALMVAQDLGIDLEPVEVPTRRRTTRKRQPNRNGPVETTVLWASVYPEAKLHALMIAGGDIKRCKPVARDTVVVLNHPQEKPPR